jgi:hypothetical protein
VTERKPYSHLPSIALFAQVPWLLDVSVWSAPPNIRLADVRDSFLLGGGGKLSARLGVGDRVSTMERIMAPYLSSYNFAENANFRKDVIKPSRDFFPPIAWAPTEQRVWRVRRTGIVITAERDDTLEFVTVNVVDPIRHVYIRHLTLRNLSSAAIHDIGIGMEAVPDIPFAIAGHRSRIEPLNDEQLIENIEELEPADRDYSPNYSNQLQRHRFLVRGTIGASTRGIQDLYVRTEVLDPGEELTAVHYLVPSLTDTAEDASERAVALAQSLSNEGINLLLEQVAEWWKTEFARHAYVGGSDARYIQLLENNLILQKQVERDTGGFVVIDDYTGNWLRDHNGSHRYLLALGDHEAVRKSMDRYYALDVSGSSLYSVYASDAEPKQPLPEEPDWSTVEGFITGDVPNFRTMWYWWYFQHTGDLEYIRERFDYILGAFHRQDLASNGYLAEYCFDETYGIGPVGPMRTGLSADNSFNALAAAERLAEFAKLLDRPEVAELETISQRIRSAIEETFWIDDGGYYAMRVTPEGALDPTPLSIGLLRPLWTGAGVDPDRAIASALYAYTHLYGENGFLRLIPSHDQTVTMAIGYLLSAMKKMLHPGIDRVFSDVLKWCDPSGTFGEYLDEREDGPWQCYEHFAHRNRMWESGLNAEAVLYTLTGFIPNAYARSLELSPYLPAGWKHFACRNFRVGASRVSLEHRVNDGRTQMNITLHGNEPLSLALTLTGEHEGTIVRVGDHAVEAEWQRSRFGILHAKLALTLEPATPLHILF